MAKYKIEAIVKQDTLMIEDFEEIAHTGGKIEMGVDGSLGMSQTSGHRCAWFVIRASYNGFPLQHVPMVGMGMNFPPGPLPSILVFIGSDREGFFGRKCPNCKGYFRTTIPADPCHCSYCGFISPSIKFMTDAQQQYINSYVNNFVQMIKTHKNVTIDLDEIANGVKSNESKLFYSENRQQTLTECDICKCEYDILGTFGFCPSCGKRNSLQILMRSLNNLSEKIEKPIYPEQEREKRDTEWKNIVVSTVSEFDGFGNDIKQQLLKIPCTIRRKKETEQISFQNLLSAHKSLLENWGVDLFEGISEEDSKFILKMFQKRHLCVHRSGIVDQEYFDKTGDKSLQIGQKIRVRSNEAKRFVSLITNIGNNFFLTYESLYKS
jgi:hypothetical protein